jgi:nitrate/nitrite transporter NarK
VNIVKHHGPWLVSRLANPAHIAPLGLDLTATQYGTDAIVYPLRNVQSTSSSRSAILTAGVRALARASGGDISDRVGAPHRASFIG